jgi:hypothetical protein
MGRSTFEGPILAGDQRFGPQRDVGSVLLVQNCFMDFSNSTSSTANYGGGSGVFVDSNGIPNQIATIWTPQNGAYSTSGPTTASSPTADATGTNYRGCTFLIPQSSNIVDVIIDVASMPTDGTHTVTAIQPYISNNFITTGNGVYGSVASISAAGRSNATYTATATANSIIQLDNACGTLQDVQNLQPGQQPTWFSQVVVTLAMTVSALTSVNAGQINVTIRYTQADLNIGNGTTYPYGNFD